MSESPALPTGEPAAQPISLVEEYGIETARWALRIVLHPRALRRFHRWHNQATLLEDLGLGHLLDAATRDLVRQG